MKQGVIENILVVNQSGNTSVSNIPSQISQLGYHVQVVSATADEIVQWQVGQTDLVIINGLREEVSSIAKHIKSACQDMQWVPIICIGDADEMVNVVDVVNDGADDYLIQQQADSLLAAKLTATERTLSLYNTLLAQSYQLQYAVEELKRLSTHDGLTGIPNRRKFDEQVVNEWRRMVREKKNLALMMTDVDHFKQYNDLYGHPAGDTCLKSVAEAISRALHRPADMVARYGGEEFAIILPDVDISGAKHVADEVLNEITAMKIPHAESSAGIYVSLSIGIGIMESPQNIAPDCLLEIADKNLYQAKEDGRNRYRIGDGLLVDLTPTEQLNMR